MARDAAVRAPAAATSRVRASLSAAQAFSDGVLAASYLSSAWATCQDRFSRLVRRSALLRWISAAARSTPSAPSCPPAVESGPASA